MAGPRVLTFNFHEPYLWLMAKTGYDFTIGSYDDPTLARQWQTQYRPVPPNMTIVSEAEWRSGLEVGRFDVIVAQNESNAASMLSCNVPGLLICHNRRTFLHTTLTDSSGDDLALYARLLDRLQERFTFIFISESKRDDYGIPGEVILPGVDVEEFGGYTGEEARILRVGNMMRQRNLMFDVDFQERACQGFPNRVAGVDPAMPEAREPRSFEELLHLYRTHRCLLHVTREEYEDGYNLSTLEAMACGMPVVSLANRTSPLTDGLDGIVSAHAEVLRGRLAELLNNPEHARILGARGRETVARKFPIGAFVENWRRAIETAAENGPRKPRRLAKDSEPAEPAPLRIAMQYIASPITTARYLEQAARQRHKVVTVGFRSPEEVLELWGFGRPYPDYPAHDVDLPLYTSCKDWIEHLPGEFPPDLFLWVDSGASRPPDDLDTLNIPKACYLIDTHVSAELRLAMARPFDTIFMAQKAHLDAFRSAGVENVFWLPLACCPELHSVPETARTCDVSFVGNPNGDASGRRGHILDDVAARFPNHHIGRAWPGEMARIYAQSKIVVNTCVARDVNMRVFEALASGALLITDEADGLEDLFEDGVHLVVYRRDADLPALIQRYLEDDDAREGIAAAGKALVLGRHTYAHRLEEMLTHIPQQAAADGASGESQFLPEGYYRHSRPELARYVPPSVCRVLDVGCGTGAFGKLLKSRGVKEVHGIEAVEQACRSAQEVLDEAVLGDIEEIGLPYEDGYFDCITFGDVLEHLVDPAAALRKVTRVLSDDGFILMSIPNVRFYAVVAMLGNGRWNYSDAGIMDRSHLRFFTAHEMRALVREAGLDVLEIDTLVRMEVEAADRAPDGSIRIGCIAITPRDEADYEDLITYQYRVIAGKPGVDRLAKARAALEIHHNESACLLAADAYGVEEFERKRIMAIASARCGMTAQALDFCHDALEMRPGDAELLGEMGVLLVAANRGDEAKSYLERALELEPENDRFVGASGLVHLLDGRLEKAMGCFERALEDSYDNIALLGHYASVAEELGRLEEAVGLVRRYADFHAGSSTAVCTCAEILVKLKCLEEARDRLETFLLLSPGDRGVQALLDSLDQLEC